MAEGSVQGNSPGSNSPSSNVNGSLANGSGNGGGSGAGSAPSSQAPGHPSFRRQRASRACETCHSRKVRCDAASLGVPCTNCVAFSIECKIPAPKRKKAQSKSKDSDSERENNDSPTTDSSQSHRGAHGSTSVPTGMPATSLTSDQVAAQNSTNTTYSQFMKPKFARAPIKEAGRVAYLGESSNLSLLVHDKFGTSDVVHYPLPDTVKGTRARLTELDNVEIDILHQRGAFLLPPRALCDELVEAFFKWVAPIVPVISRTRFMRRYRDNKNPPSLLLLQAILLAGSRVCTNPQLMDASGSTTPAAMTFYKRAKALYDANYEDDRVTIVQALVLMGWYWEGPEGKYTDKHYIARASDIASDVTKNVFYWSRVATIVAQGSGMHRSVEGSQLSRPDKRLWKRIWWTLFTRDRSVAVALGRPVHINTDDSDVEMINEDDFVEDEFDTPSEYPPDHTHVQFFLQYVRLCEIMGLVLSQQYSVATKGGRQNAINLAHSDMALADWLQNCPREVSWERSRHHFWSALLHSNYYTTLCLLHRAHMPPATSQGHHNISNGFADDTAYPSRTIAFQAAGMITSIVEALSQHDEIRFTPAFIVYSLFSALIMHVYQMRSSIPSVVEQTQERIHVCMTALKDVSKVWLVAKMVHTLFLSILGNKNLEERLQKAAGKRHKKMKLDNQPQAHTAGADSPPKTRFDDMSLAYSTGPPAPQVSFERSRPQTPSISEGGAQPGQTATTSPTLRHNDAFLGSTASRNETRPGTPFNPSYSIPATPPDLYLVTRNSPTISQSLWENFQPDQLFPGNTGMNFNNPFAPQNHTNLDPALQMPGMQTPTMNNVTLTASAQQQQSPNAGMNQSMGMGMHSGDWAGQLSPEDTWSNDSRSAVPTTLNVEDWMQFFGMNQGDMNGLAQQTQDTAF